MIYLGVGCGFFEDLELFFRADFFGTTSESSNSDGTSIMFMLSSGECWGFRTYVSLFLAILGTEMLVLSDFGGEKSLSDVTIA